MMEERNQIIFKLALIVVCVALFIWLIQKDEKDFQLTQPQGEGIAVEDVLILMGAVSGKETVPLDERRRIKLWMEELADTYGEGSRENLSYEDFERLAENLSQEELSWKNQYKNDFYLLKRDWYEAYELFLTGFGLGESIKTGELELLTGNAAALGKELSEGRLIDGEGKERGYRSGEFEKCFFSRVEAYLDGDELLVVKERKTDPFTLHNLWIMETGKESVQFFYQGYEMEYENRDQDKHGEVKRETVADLTFGKGELAKVKTKEERVNGRLLRISQEELEIEGKGTFPIDGECRLYQLYEELRKAGWEELRIGYDFTDFVLEDGRICAGLIMRKENMESIRVAVRSNGFSSLYHESICLRADCEAALIYGPYEKRVTKELKAGEELTIEPGCEYLGGDRIEIVPSVKSGKIEVSSLSRKQGTPSYRGRMEITATDMGLVLINELLLEEYLYSVVPSEMPASYSLEALKAQAVCARTYAYRYLSSPGFGSLGAHVDDSINYQVYNNVEENVNSTRAVKETTGDLLYYGDEAVSTYYYSTSCGFGTDAGVWTESSKETLPYLSALHISQEEGDADDFAKRNQRAEEMRQEEAFRDYILNVNEADYEKDEAWYRWEYDVPQLDPVRISERMQKRFRADSGKVVRLDEEGGKDGEKGKVEAFTEIYDMEITSRREGGIADELLIETDAGDYLVHSEYNIRYLLNDGGSVEGQDGSRMKIGDLLPSAYFVLDIVKEGEGVIGYSIFGGGYGHGVGMSQNGARVMAGEGKSFGEILTFFYPGCELKKIY